MQKIVKLVKKILLSLAMIVFLNKFAFAFIPVPVIAPDQLITQIQQTSTTVTDTTASMSTVTSMQKMGAKIGQGMTNLNKMKEKAEAAKAKADKIKKKAKDAKAKADKIKKKAEDAKKKVNDAKGKFNDAKGKLDDAKGKFNDAKDKVSDVKDQAGIVSSSSEDAGNPLVDVSNDDNGSSRKSFGNQDRISNPISKDLPIQKLGDPSKRDGFGNAPTPLRDKPIQKLGDPSKRDGFGKAPSFERAVPVQKLGNPRKIQKIDNMELRELDLSMNDYTISNSEVISFASAEEGESEISECVVPKVFADMGLKGDLLEVDEEISNFVSEKLVDAKKTANNDELSEIIQIYQTAARSKAACSYGLATKYRYEASSYNDRIEDFDKTTEGGTLTDVVSKLNMVDKEILDAFSRLVEIESSNMTLNSLNTLGVL